MTDPSDPIISNVNLINPLVLQQAGEWVKQGYLTTAERRVLALAAGMVAGVAGGAYQRALRKLAADPASRAGATAATMAEIVRGTAEFLYLLSGGSRDEQERAFRSLREQAELCVLAATTTEQSAGPA